MYLPILRNIWRLNRSRGNNHGLCIAGIQFRQLFTQKIALRKALTRSPSPVGLHSLLLSCGLIFFLYNTDQSPLDQGHRERSILPRDEVGKFNKNITEDSEDIGTSSDKNTSVSFLGENSWATIISSLAVFSDLAESGWNSITNTVTDYVLPEWAKSLPDQIGKLQRELSMAPGSLADQIWQEARDPYINPEIEYNASVRVSADLCDQERLFLTKRRNFTRVALANYLGIPLEEIHPDDVPTIALVGSGGGLRALVAGAGSMLATEKDGLLDCVTYTAGVSGSCWLQALFNSSICSQSLEKVIAHIKARIGIHIAYPPVALNAVNSSPTNKYLLSGLIEKLRGDPDSNLGLVDIYGLLLGARLLVPKGELGVNEVDFKISNQKQFMEHGQNPMPIYTAVRHHIPVSEKQSDINEAADSFSQKKNDKSRKEAWFQWFEISPFEMFCEEFGAGIPTWAMGRKFENGWSFPLDEDGLHVPELRLPLLLGIFGSAFCATLAHYYQEVKPLFKAFTGFTSMNQVIENRYEYLSQLHPIDPANIPNFAYKMFGKLPGSVPEEIFNMKHLQLMDAGMSNNLPIYPLLRPGRNVEIMIIFDASADIKTGNWLSVVEGYANQRGVKGWPVGAGWPKLSDSAEKTVDQLYEAQATTAAESFKKLKNAQSPNEKMSDLSKEDNDKDLGHCTIWVGRTEERHSSSDQVKSKAVEEDWELMQPNSGISVIYFPFISNKALGNFDPSSTDYLSTWNFVYTPEEIENVVTLARTNFEMGKDKTRRCVRAVYERKKKEREEIEKSLKEKKWRRKVRLGIVGKKGDGDHFYLT
ncbi:Cytosolic phospholipase A2 zeta [Golovinomyces cichoracearum]|uniref:Lysophospholipase n=1 Tax=Golovinomyces cichoracearum TaxID=62708 RepID=A0A420HAZ0_9PEZI|nr:Cytosolic phospholipase A2 zeta [Golovinomyces cichoracearum]